MARLRRPAPPPAPPAPPAPAAPPTPAPADATGTDRDAWAFAGLVWRLEPTAVLAALATAVKAAHDREDALVTLTLGARPHARDGATLAVAGPDGATAVVALADCDCTPIGATPHALRGTLRAAALRDAMRSGLGTPRTEPVLLQVAGPVDDAATPTADAPDLIVTPAKGAPVPLGVAELTRVPLAPPQEQPASWMPPAPIPDPFTPGEWARAARFAGPAGFVERLADARALVATTPEGSCLIVRPPAARTRAAAGAEPLRVRGATAQALAHALLAAWSARKLALKPGFAAAGTPARERQAAYARAMPALLAVRAGNGASHCTAGQLALTVPALAMPAPLAAARELARTGEPMAAARSRAPGVNGKTLHDLMAWALAGDQLVAPTPDLAPESVVSLVVDAAHEASLLVVRPWPTGAARDTLRRVPLGPAPALPPGVVGTAPVAALLEGVADLGVSSTIRLTRGPSGGLRLSTPELALVLQPPPVVAAATPPAYAILTSEATRPSAAAAVGAAWRQTQAASRDDEIAALIAEETARGVAPPTSDGAAVPLPRGMRRTTGPAPHRVARADDPAADARFEAYLAALQRDGVLKGRMTDEQRVRAVVRAQAGHASAREALVRVHFRFLLKLAHDVRRRYVIQADAGPGVSVFPLREAFSLAVEALLYAIDQWQPGRGAALLHLAAVRLRSLAATAALAASFPVLTVREFDALRPVATARRALLGLLGRFPTAAEITAHLEAETGATTDAQRRALARSVAVALRTLDSRYAVSLTDRGARREERVGRSGRHPSLEQVLPAAAPTPEPATAPPAATSATLARVLRTLPPAGRAVLSATLGTDAQFQLSPAEYALWMGTTTDSALNHLKAATGALASLGTTVAALADDPGVAPVSPTPAAPPAAPPAFRRTRARP